MWRLFRESQSSGRNDLVQQTHCANSWTLTEEHQNVGQGRRPNGCRAGYFLARRDKLLSPDWLEKKKKRYTLSLSPTLSKNKKTKQKNRNVYPLPSAHSLLHHRPSLLYCEQVLALAALMCLLGNLGLWGSLWFSTSAQRTQCTSSCRLLTGHFHLGQDVPQAKTEPGFSAPPTPSILFVAPKCWRRPLVTPDNQNTVKKQSSKSTEWPWVISVETYNYFFLQHLYNICPEMLHLNKWMNKPLFCIKLCHITMSHSN